ncbi:MAG: type IX secretion system protein PorQ [Bacteroidales bacterium]|nr:type IX secretion system protein PorQ [Bacteroidales bacterium]
MKRINIIIILIVLPFFINAQTGGKGVFDFLNINSSARVASLGGTNISIYDEDLNLAFQNPALLNSEMNNKIYINYLNYFAGINIGSVGYAYKHKKFGTISVGLQYLNYGTFTAADETGIISGEFNASDYALNLIWSKDLFKNIKGGVNIKPVYSHAEVYNSFGIVVDAGITYYKTEEEFAASLVLKNIGTQIKPYYKGHFEKVPFDIQMGVSKKLAHAPFRVNLTAHSLNKWNLRYEIPEKVTQISFADESDTNKGEVLTNILDNSLRHLILGVELIPLKSFYVSLGYNHQRRQEMKIYEKGGTAGFSWGFGLKLKKMGISFARATYHLAGASNHFSFYFDMSKMGKKKNIKIQTSEQ